jgi:uncharacterized protein
VNFSLPIVLKFAADGQEGEFTGLASTWNRDRQGDTITPGAFADSMAALNAGTTKVPLLSNHRADVQIGVVQNGTETDQGLLVTGRIIKGTTAADRAHQLAQAGGLSLSVGFLPKEAEPQTGGGLLYRKVDLVEVSAVSTPANRESRVLTVRSLALSEASDLEEMLREGGLPPLPRRLASRFARLITRALDADDTDDIDPAEETALANALAAAKQSFITRK